ncbi:MAG: hypothetical protein P8X55_03815 [Desulfosarcinaceae bacterium]
MTEEILKTTLDSMRDVAAQVPCCPACLSTHIYTAAHVTYVYDHNKGHMTTICSLNLAENGWHGCFDCDHQWISSPMIETAVPRKTSPREKPDNVIDLQAFKQER